MLKLTKAQRQEFDDLLEALRDRQAEVGGAVEDLNLRLSDAWSKTFEAQEEYNEALANLRLFISEAAEAWRNEFDEKSEKWQEGERGQAASEWIDQWESIDLEDLELTRPDDMECEVTHADDAEELPETPE